MPQNILGLAQPTDLLKGTPFSPSGAQNGSAPREVDTQSAAAKIRPESPKPESASGIPQFSENPLAAMGVILSQTAAGLMGQEGPVEKANARAIEQQSLKLRQTAATFDAVKFGAEVLQQTPPEGHEKIIANIERTVQLPGVGDMLRALGGSKTDTKAVIGFLDENPELLPGLAGLIEKGVVDAKGAVGMVTDLISKQAEAKLQGEKEIKVAEAKAAAEGKNKPTKGVEVVQGGTARAKELGLPDKGSFEVKTENGVVTDVNTLGSAGTTVNVDLSKESEKEAIKLSGEADDLSLQVEQLQQFRQLAGETDTNALVPVTKPIQEILSAGGINIGDKKQIELRQVFESLQNTNALWFRNPESGFGLTGNTSDRDVKFLKSIGGQLSNTPEANDAILTILVARQRRKAELSQAKSDFLFETGSLVGWSGKKKEILEKSVFTADERASLERLAQKAERADSAIGLQEMSDDDLLKLAPESSVDPDEYEKELKRRGLL